MTMTIEEKLRDNLYSSKLPYVSAKKDKAANEAYTADEHALRQQFKQDMFEEFGVLDHPKAEKAFEIAWGYGHSSGFHEVFYYFTELAELLI